MKNFEFHNPVQIFFGRDQITKIAAGIPPSANIMLIYGGGSIFKNGVYDKVKEALQDFQGN